MLIFDQPIKMLKMSVAFSVTRLGDFLHVGQLFKAVGNN